MDQKPESIKEGKKFDLELHSARTQTPLPGQRDGDIDASALPSARHAVKDEYSDYVKLAKQGGHQGKNFYFHVFEAFFVLISLHAQMYIVDYSFNRCKINIQTN